MNTSSHSFIAACVFAALTTLNLSAATHYVWQSSPGPAPPYTNWTTAATNIQQAVDAAVAGDEIVVTNGTYAGGSRVDPYGAPGCVLVNKPLTVRSVNGPDVTVINGGGAVRCLYLTNAATLVGFTLTNGVADNGGGVYCESTSAVLTNCVLSGNSAANVGGGACGGTLNNCTLSANAANGPDNWDYDVLGGGGGAFGSTLNKCTLTGNSASYEGGGAYGGTLNNCTLTGNTANGYWFYGPFGGGGSYVSGAGGGAYSSTLDNCTLTGNSANSGGGAAYSTLNNCAFTANTANGYYECSCCGCQAAPANPDSLRNTAKGQYIFTGYDLYAGGVGGGAYICTLNNCTLTGNSANSGGGAVDSTLNNCALTANTVNGYYDAWGDYFGGVGGGAYSDASQPCALNNCTLTGNSASDDGGGAYSCTLNNCIVYFNLDTHGGNYDPSSALNYCCATPLPSNGVGNISAEPQLASTSHLSAESPCIRAGSATYATGTDIDGEAWANPPSIGCDEYHARAVTGPLTASLTATFTNVATGFPVGLTAFIEGRTDLSVWDFGDGFVEVNQPYTSHTWTTPGDYLVALWVFNDSYPGGVGATLTIHVEDGLRYVAATSGNPVAPYTTWATAATNIQDAVDVAVAGGTVFVTNGTYAAGGRTTLSPGDGATNRVAVDKPLTVRSVNGPGVTVIQGQMPGATDGYTRCVYLTNAATLVGFTLTNGVAGIGGGVYGESTSAVLSNCVLSGNSANGYVDSYYDYIVGYGGGGFGGTLNNCTLTGNSAANSGGGAGISTLNNCTLSGNSAWNGGGAAWSMLNNCTLTGNSAGSGGGACGGTLNTCTLTGNSADQSGGGASDGTLNNCTLTGNWAWYGGGTSRGTLNNCTLTGNSGSGADNCTLNNCTVTGNSGWGASSATLNNCVVSGNTGGGVSGSTLNNCTVTGNSGWGVSSATLNNCICYFNKGGNYDPSSTLNYCCTTPLPGYGAGNTTADPQLASALHLSAASPCRGAGSARYASGTDIDGEAWANPPSIGCDEYHAGAVTGPLSVAILADYTNVATGFAVIFAAQIVGHASANIWDFGDGSVVSNRPYASHGWMATGDYPVILRVYNDTYPGGVAASIPIHVMARPVHYVVLSSPSPAAPYTSWATAATRIQDAVDAASVPGALVLVSNGVYRTGSRYVDQTNRVAVTKPLTVQGVNGPGVTIINGSGTVRCVYLTNDAALTGFTLTNGVAPYGGGVYCESSSAVLSNCVLSGNSGGGASRGTLNNCTLTGNSGGGADNCTLKNCTVTENSGWGTSSATLNNCVVSGNTGGGASGSTLINCTVTGNSGWGVSSATLNNSIVYFNADPSGGNHDSSTILNYCCTTPMPPNGVGNLSADPQLASASHLSAESPCIRAGSATYASGTDIDGEAWANPPSIGCDEYHAGAVTGPLTVSLTATLTNVMRGFPVGLTAFIQGRTDLSVWEFGDGFVAVNEPYTSHAWTALGDYLVALWVFNDSYPGGVRATLTIHVEEGLHYVAATSVNPVAPYTSWATAARNIQDAVDVAPPGATILVTNGAYAAGGRTTPSPGDGATNRVAVDKPLTVRSVNGPGVTVIQGRMLGAANGYLRCVYLTNAATLVGFTLTNGVAGYGGGVYCESTSAVLSNCVLSGNSGGGALWGTLNNCTLTGNSGSGAYRCTLNNCTLTGNSAYGGGGACYSTLNNCALTRNSASGWYDSLGNYWSGVGGGAYACTLNNCTLTGNSAREGGGACGGRLNNCTLTGNSANGRYDYNGNYFPGVGGGASGSTLNNSTLIGNSASDEGGGAFQCALNNCILYFNSAPVTPNYGGPCTLNYCCIAPLPDSGMGNITIPPLFVDQAHGNLRPQPNSPCINAGNNDYVVGGIDLDGNPRIVSGTVDLGAYEFQGTGSVISYAWLAQYRLPIDGSADFADPDGDGMNNWEEWRCGTNPTDASSALRLLSPQRTGTNVTVTWQSVAGVNYFLERATNLSPSPLFTPLATNIPGQPGTTSYTDTNAAGPSPLFYRVGVGN